MKIGIKLNNILCRDVKVELTGWMDAVTNRGNG